MSLSHFLMVFLTHLLTFSRNLPINLIIQVHQYNQFNKRRNNLVDHQEKYILLPYFFYNLIFCYNKNEWFRYY